MASLLDSEDPVLSLLSNVASGFRVGPADTPVYGMDPQGNPLPSRMSPHQSQSAMDALLAFGAAAANAAAPRFGPAPTLMQGLTESLQAGRSSAINEQVAQAQMADMALKRQILQQQLQGQQLVGRFLTRFGVGDVTSAPPEPGAPGAAPGAAPGYTPGAAVREALGGAEGGARGYEATNAGGYSGRYQIGSELAKDAGFYTPGENENLKANPWAGTFNIPGFAQVKTRDDFLRNPAAQDAAYNMAMSHNDKQLQSLGVYDRGVGQMIAGVPVTREGLLAGAWLGGPAGVKAWVDSGGKEDRRDSNGTPISAWVALGAPGGKGQPAPQTNYQLASNVALPPPAPAAAPGTVAYPGAPDAPVAAGAGLPTAATPAQLAAAPAPPPIAPAVPVVPGAPAAPAAPPAPVAVPGAPVVPAANAAALGARGAAGTAAPQPGQPPVVPASLVAPATAPATAAAAPGIPARPVVLPPIPGMNRGALDSMSARDKALLGVSLLSMSPDKWAPALAQLAARPGEAPQMTTLGDTVYAIYRDGTRVPMGPAHQEPFNVDRQDDQGNVRTFRVDPNRGTEQDLGVKSQTPLVDINVGGTTYKAWQGRDGQMHLVAPAPIPPASQPLSAERQQQEERLRRAGQQTAEDVFQQKSGEGAAKQQDDLTNSGTAAGSMLQTLRRFEAIAGGFQSGKLAPTAANLGAIGQSVGVDLGGLAASMSSRSVTQAEILQKISNELVKGQISTGSGFSTNLSDADRQFLEKTMPSISNRPESNDVILAFLKSAAQRSIDKSVTWQRQGGPHEQGEDPHSLKAWRAFNSEWLDKQNQDPILHDVDNEAAALKLPVGSVVRMPNGDLHVVKP